MSIRHKLTAGAGLLLCAGMLAAGPCAGIAGAEEVTEEITETAASEAAAEDYAVCKVNGESVMNSQYRSNYTYYTLMFSSAGYDVSSDEVSDYIRERVQEATLRSVLLRQGMEEDGYYGFTEDEEKAFEQEAESEYASYEETYTLEEMEAAGYSVASLTSAARTEAAMDRLYDDLMDGYEITDDDIKDYYDQAVAQDEANYKDNEELYEKVSENTSADIWYSPEDGAVEYTDEVKEKIRNILWENERNERLDDYIANLRENAVVLTLADPDYE